MYCARARRPLTPSRVSQNRPTPIRMSIARPATRFSRSLFLPSLPGALCLCSLFAAAIGAVPARADLVAESQARFDSLLLAPELSSAFVAALPDGSLSTGNLQLEQFGKLDILPVLYLPEELESFVSDVEVKSSARLWVESEAALDDPGPWAWFGRWRRNNLSYTSIDLFRTSAARLTRAWWRVSGRFLRLSDAISSSSLLSFVEKSAVQIENDQLQLASTSDQSAAASSGFGSPAESVDAFSTGTLFSYVRGSTPIRNSTFVNTNRANTPSLWAGAPASSPALAAVFPSSASLVGSSVLSAGFVAVNATLIAPDAEILFGQPGPPSDLSPVPEPATWTGLAFLGVLVALFRLRQQKTHPTSA